MVQLPVPGASIGRWESELTDSEKETAWRCMKPSFVSWGMGIEGVVADLFVT